MQQLGGYTGVENSYLFVRVDVSTTTAVAWACSTQS